MKTINIKWSTDDVLWRAEDMNVKITEEQADDVLSLLESNHDANVGINWDVIDYYIGVITKGED